ncbi:phage tail domain-containing protein [Bacillus cereus group sp. N15]|uniref:phage tail domain-containing protein n=1 Tax=Bacillus cereus group sp. N15 TaxID=2794588 RepID=UPI0018F2CC20|nr:phage tail domain-containing protein [Bacillus cereus group sp. N15]MBJ8063426.1 phage tail family protein [Bacillus cereus group sp. N15]
MTNQTLTIIQEDGSKFVISSNDKLTVLNFLPNSPFYNTGYEKLDGRHGEIDLGGSFNSRDDIKSLFLAEPHGIDDFYKVRNFMFRLFGSQSPFYIVSNREPEKRWKVRVSSKYEVEPQANGNYSLIEIQYKSANAFAESVQSTLEKMKTEYTRTTATFSIDNKGEVEIDPRQMPLRITFKGASENLKIKNKTTKDEWTYNGTTTDKDTIVIDQVRSTKNSLSIVRNTNKKVISLREGINEFEITGAKGAFSISFDFRFQYL